MSDAGAKALAELNTGLSDLNLIDAFGAVEELVEVFKYQGFNPQRFIGHLAAIYTQKMGKDTVGFKKDLGAFAVLFVQRGTKISKMLGKTSAAGIDKISTLRSRYNVVDVLPTTADTVTVARIAACIPMVVVNTITALDKKGEFKVIGNRQPMPLEFHFTGAPALFPKDDYVLFNVWVAWAVSFSKTIKKSQSAAEVAKYGKIIRDSAVAGDAARDQIAKDLGWPTNFMGSVPSELKAEIIYPDFVGSSTTNPNSNTASSNRIIRL